MLQTEVLRPWLRLSVDTFRLGLQVQSSVMSLFNNGQALMRPVADAPEAPTPLASALAGTPYAPDVAQAVTDEISSESRASKPRAVRLSLGRHPSAPRKAVPTKPLSDQPRSHQCERLPTERAERIAVQAPTALAR